MLFRKVLYLVMSILFVVLAIFVHPAFIFPLVIFIVVLFNETDFLHYENPSWDKPDLSRLLDPKAAPVEIVNNSDKAIIFVHGFPSCPATFSYVTPMAEDAGYDVFVPLLPGFGTCNEDFIKSNFTQWYGYLSDFYLEKRKQYKTVYIVGLSMGAALTLRLAEKYSDTVYAPDAISVTAAPVFLNSIRYGINKSWLLYLIRFLSVFVKFLDNKSESWKKMEDNHSEWLGYRGIFPKQVYSLKMGITRIRGDLGKITVPLIAFHVPEDRTVNYKSFPYIERNISSNMKVFKTIEYKGFYNTSHCLFLYESLREKLFNDILEFFGNLNPGVTGSK